MPRVEVLDDPEAVQVLSHPIRLKILAALDPATSAAGVARVIGLSRQNAHYHLKELERVGLVVRAGERRVGNFVETLYRARARSLLVSPRMTLGGAQRAKAMADQYSLEQLIGISERLGRDAVVLLDQAAFEGKEVASASVEIEVALPGAPQRQAFLNEYLQAVAALAKKYGRQGGMGYRVVMAAYPDPEPDINSTETRKEGK